LQGKPRFNEINLRQVPEILGNSDDQNPHPSMHSTDVSMVHRPLIAAVNYRIKDNVLST